MTAHDLRCAGAVLLLASVLPLVAVLTPIAPPRPLSRHDRILVVIVVAVFIAAL